MNASPRIGDTIWATHRRYQPERLPCKGDREVRPSCRNWSRSSVRLKSFVQYSYPHASLVLQRRHPPCARESSCVRIRLLPWRDAAAERPALGLLQAGPSLSPPWVFLAFPAYLPPKLPSTLPSILVGSPPRQFQVIRICLGESDHCPLGQSCSPSVACKGHLDVENTSVLIHSRQREGQESWKEDIERIVLTAEH